MQGGKKKKRNSYVFARLDSVSNQTVFRGYTVKA